MTEGLGCTSMQKVSSELAQRNTWLLEESVGHWRVNIQEFSCTHPAVF